MQREVEALLCERAASLGVLIRRGVEVTGVEQSEEGVTLHTDAGDVSARYVVGCDGGRSIVRRSVSFNFPGTNPEITGRQAVVDLDDTSELKFGWNWWVGRTEEDVGTELLRTALKAWAGNPKDIFLSATTRAVEASRGFNRALGKKLTGRPEQLRLVQAS